MENNKIKIKNISTNTIGIYCPELRLNRVILPNKIVTIDKDIFEEYLSYPGADKLVKNYLWVEDKELREITNMSLGIDEDSETEESHADLDEIKTILKGSNKTKKNNLFKDITPARAKTIANVATEIIDELTTETINKVQKETGYDILKASQLNKED